MTAAQQGLIEKVYRTFFSPPAYDLKPANRAVLAEGRNQRMAFEGRELAITEWGEGEKAALLMHGWGGSRGQMTGFVEPLLANGYRVVAYDQPANGDSDGELTNLFELAPTMGFVAQEMGHFDTILAHSFGTLVTSYALVQGYLPMARRLVYFGSLNRLMDTVPRFQVIANLPDAVIDGLRAMLRANFGEGVLEALSNEALAPLLPIPALMFHDKADPVTPIEDSRAIAAHWRQAQMIETDGLGHRGALSNSTIHQQVIQFLSA